MSNANDCPLNGLKVVELSTVVAAPSAARVLSVFGAEVIKVEAPSGDLLRGVGDGLAFPIEDDNNPLFDLFNSGKKMIALDLKSEGGMQVMMKLLADADIFISNVRMKSLEKMGLGYNSLHAEFPDLIYGHFSGYGLEGEESGAPGFDTTAFWMRSGAMLDTVPDGALPIRPSYGFGDLASSGHFVSGIMMALYARDRGKGGRLVSTSLLASGLWHNSVYVLNSQDKYGREYPLDRYEPWNPFFETYLCSDGEWIGIMCKQYPKDRFVFAELFDIPELAEDKDFETLKSLADSGRKAEITGRVEAKILEKTSAEWLDILNEKDIPAARMMHYRDASKDPQAHANGYLESFDHGDGSKALFPRPPITMPGTERKALGKAGVIGADSCSILERLGYDGEEIEDLISSGAVVMK